MYHLERFWLPSYILKYHAPLFAGLMPLGLDAI